MRCCPSNSFEWPTSDESSTCFVNKGPVSRAALVRLTGLSGQSVGVIVGRLLDQGLVEETGVSPQSGVGRHPIGVRIRPNGALAFGCNIERDRIDAAWIDLNGNVVLSGSDSFAQGEEPARTIQRVEELFDQLTAALPMALSTNALPAIGLGLPGPMDPISQTLVNPPNFPHWEGVDPRLLFSTSWRAPIFCENSATAAALGEAWQSRSRLSNFLYCHWGVGIGGGLVIDLDTYRGSTGNALELGHVPVVANGTPCDCGSRGCLEAEISVAAICRQASALGFGDDFDQIVMLAQAEPRLVEIFNRAGQLLAQALLGAVNLFDIDTVVIGGHHFRQVADWLLPPVETAIQDFAMRRNVRPVTVQYSIVDEAAGAVGAASVVFDKLLPTSPPLVAPSNRLTGSEQRGSRD